MIIPYKDLPAETLHSMIESVVLREGTDYGEEEQSLASKVAQIQKQLESGELVIVYSEEYESINILPAGQFVN